MHKESEPQPENVGRNGQTRQKVTADYLIAKSQVTGKSVTCVYDLRLQTELLNRCRKFEVFDNGYQRRDIEFLGPVGRARGHMSPFLGERMWCVYMWGHA